jgi:HlyD family secretion protein
MAALRQTASSFFTRNRWWIFASAILAAVVLLAAFNSMRADVISIRTARIMRSTIRSSISTNGKVEPLQNFEAHAPVATTVKKVLAKEGDHVRRGQLLLQLDDADARTSAARALAQLKAAQADIHATENGGTREELLTLDTQLVKAQADRDAAQRNLDAMQRLQKNGAASAGEVKDAENQARTTQANLQMLQQKRKERFSQPEIAKVEAQKGEAQAAYDAAQEVLSKSNVRAPFDGVVYVLPVRAGNYVNPGDLLLQEADLSKVRVRAFVDEPDVGRLHPNQRIDVNWDAIPGRTWQGLLTAVPATVKLFGARNVGEILTVLDNADYKLLPNVNVSVQIITAEHRDALVAPREAVRIDDTQPYVYQVVEAELHRRPVQTAIANLTQVEIVSGVSEKELIALSSINNKALRDKQPVKVVQ